MRPAHLHFLIFKPGYKTHISQVYVNDDVNLETDVQFGVTRSLVGHYIRHEDEKPPAPDVQGPWYSLDFTFIVEPGTVKLPRPPITGKADGERPKLEILERAWTQERFSYEGQFWQIPELSLSPKPLQKPHPPLYRGLSSPEAFEPAGAKGHGALCVPWLTPETRLKEGMARYRAALRAHGHQAVPPSMFVFFLFVDQDYRQALAEARETTGRYVELGLRSLFPAGLAANLPPDDPLRGGWDMITSMADHLEERAIIGTPRDCRRRLAEVREEWGIEHIAFYLHAGARDIGRARKGLELFAREVMPEFQ